jgi:hypothetical protein
MTVPPIIRRLFDDPLALGEALGYKGDASGRKVFGPLHRGIINHSQTQPWTYCQVPRGHAKSTLLSVILPIAKLLRDPNRRILVASATLDLAKKLIGEIRDRLNGSLELKPGLFAPVSEVFPHLALDSADRRSQGPTAKLNIMGRQASGGREPSIFAGAVSSNLAGNHPTDAHFDDLCNEQNSRTYGQRQKVIEFVQQAVPLMRYPDSPITVIGTPWAFGDVLDYLRHHSGWAGMSYGVWDGVNEETMKADGKGPGPDGAYPLCPSFLNSEEIGQIQDDVSKVFFAAQYLCDPIPSEEALFDRYLTDAATDSSIVLPEDSRRQEILLFDPVHRLEGERTGKQSLNGLMMVAPIPAKELGLQGVDPDRNIFVPTGAWEINGGTDEAVCFIEDLAASRPSMRSLWIEKKAAQETLAPWLEERGRLKGVRIRSQQTSCTALPNRLMGLVTAMRKGFVKFLPEFEGKELLFRRLHEFPLSDSDDILAAFALLSTMLERMGSLPGLDDPPPPQDYGTTIWT